MMNMKKWQINKERCMNCGGCVSVCPFAALELEKEIVWYKEKCTYCGICERVCPVSAIKVQRK
jgi:ferredoxin